MANSIITRPSVFGTALDNAASIHRNQTWQVKDGRQHLFLEFSFGMCLGLFFLRNKSVEAILERFAKLLNYGTPPCCSAHEIRPLGLTRYSGTKCNSVALENAVHRQ